MGLNEFQVYIFPFPISWEDWLQVLQLDKLL